MKNRFWIVLLLAFACSPGFLFAQPQSISLFQVATGFTEPVDMTHAGDGRLFVVEQRGTIAFTEIGSSGPPTIFMDLQSIVRSTGGEQGLLGLAFAPDYPTSGHFYVNYTNSGGDQVISRFSRSANNPNQGDPGSESIILTIPQPFTNHNGGDLEFDGDGNLLIAVGDGGDAGDPFGYGQDTTSLLGSLLRINLDPATGVPLANPYYYPTGGAQREILAPGLRNPWRIAVDPVTQNIWMGDVGQNAFEEIDLLVPDDRRIPNNFGWRCYEANSSFDLTNCGPPSSYIPPVLEYANGPNGAGCSVTGGRIYRGSQFKNLWGYYFYGDFCTGFIRAIPYDDNSGAVLPSVPVTNTSFNISSFGEDYRGEMYVLDYQGGILYRLADTTCTPKASIREGSLLRSCDGTNTLHARPGIGYTYQWYENGQPIPNATDSIYVVSGGGNFQVEVTNGNCSDLSDTTRVRPGTIDAHVYGVPLSYPLTGAPLTFDIGPFSGILTGPGANLNTFDPSVAGAGVHTLYVEVDNGVCTGLDSVTIEVLPLGVDENKPWTQLQVFPNPTSDLIWLSWRQQVYDQVEITLFDAAGREVKTQQEFRTPGEQILQLDLGALSTGVYNLRFSVGEESSAQRILVE